MSNAVLPALAGLKYPVGKTPMWSGKVQTSVSGKETRLSYWSYPRWKWTIGYEVLRNSGGFTDLQQLVGFYNARQGQFDDWLFTDPDDNSVTLQQFGQGDGATLVFGLSRSYGGFAEPVTAINGTPTIYQIDGRGTMRCLTGGRTNLLLYSNVFNNAAWTVGGATISGAGYTTGPNGAFDSNFGLVEDTSTGLHRIYQSYTPTWANGVLTGVFEVFLRNVGSGRQWVCLQADNGSALAYFDVVNGVVGTGSGAHFYAAEMVACSNGWYRCRLHFIPTATTATNAQIILASANGTNSYTGSGTFSGGVAVYQASVEISYGFGVYPPPLYSLATNATNGGTDYTLSSSGVVTFAIAPYSVSTLNWTGSYYWRVRWDEMDFTLEKMMAGLWSSADISFTSVK